MSKPKITVTIEGGVADVSGDTDLVDIIIIDLDVAEDGLCPECGSEDYDIDFDECPDCGYSLDTH